ncbi:MAG: hypothetical protein J07AB43_00580 [Candidatus Nanosalina sp. J07AB43]|nr:MAG: hypothetical protein J07AB43_00580 [Candidatus Nanosalina sp. J07AB43]
MNGTLYNLNESIRESIQDRARREYEENETFSCWWKVASPEQYDTEDEWNETVHESGDPVLVIETMGVMVPWERLDRLKPETIQEDEPDNSSDEDDGKDRTHFRQESVTKNSSQTLMETMRQSYHLQLRRCLMSQCW